MSDAILTTLLQNQLDHISQQMGWVMQRTARSPIFSESHDFSCFIADADGRLVSVADGIPIHTGGGGFAVKAVLRDFGSIGSIRPGDTFILSDPYEAGGNHLPDWTIINPVFVDGRLIAFTCNRAHQSDIGGGAAGTYNAAATEIFHEGIRLPVLKLVEGGQLREDLWRLLKLNSRCPHLIDGDVRAMIGSTKIGARRIEALTKEFGLETVEKAFSGILDHAERRMRKAISELPDGVYEGMDSSDTDCFEEIDIPVRVRVEIKGNTVLVDFTGSSQQVRGFKNSSLANTVSAVYVALFSYLDTTIPRNAGAFRPVTIVAPEGSVVNARYPAPMTSNTVYPATEIIYAVWKALAKVAADRACAGWGKAAHCISSGKDAEGATYVMYHMHAYPGTGAVQGRDGFPSLGTVITLGGMQIPNVEVFERKYPVRVEQQEMRCDAAGAGEFRGGTGIDYKVTVFDGAEYSFRGEGSGRSSGFGIVGGLSGAKADVVVFDEQGTGMATPRYGVMTLPAVKIAISSSAGGGWGRPIARPPEKVLRDVEDGLVSLDEAREIYSVAINDNHSTEMSIDWEATSRLRDAAQSQKRWSAVDHSEL
ncbi:Acetophenone carboxylase delta subunit [Ensifer psoraleae]|uniref:hydantoinase B/oxoprolinase family protein n=1 Tax=Sinorhizobium psoraleae TaxID=520838 RepID=UPI00156A6508|nr:hydantoinase B/oxoprolinase family protein [Sinorhizobium psoraleae]NRP75237.1 Acetophenone carboxylase delta subunit [Sinorhizobium psoraleae]